MRKAVYWILEFTSKLPVEEQIKCLKANDCDAIKCVLKYALDPKVEWVLPAGNPPYTPCEFSNLDGQLYTEIRKLNMFVKGGYDHMPTIKRERLFIDFIQTLHPKDAELILAAKEKRLPYPIAIETVQKAFPGLI